jgi:hypothetical protein
MTLEMGQEGSLSATPMGRGGRTLAEREVGWTSAAPSIASVDAAGRVTALRPGVATITAKADAASTGVQVTVRPDVGAVAASFLERWAGAFEAGDVGALEAAAPLQADARTALEALLANATDISADMRVGSIEQQGDEAVARIGGQWRWKDRQAGATTFAPSLLLRLERGADGWRPVGLAFEGG